MTATEARRIVLSALASAAPVPAAATDETIPTLEEHDARFHPNGYKPGDSCKFRDQLAKEDDADLLADAEKKEGMEKAEHGPSSSAAPKPQAPVYTAPKLGRASTKAIKDALGGLCTSRYSTPMSTPAAHGKLAVATNGSTFISLIRDQNDPDALADLAIVAPSLVPWVDKNVSSTSAEVNVPSDIPFVGRTTISALEDALDRAPASIYDGCALYFDPSTNPGRLRICGVRQPEGGEKEVGAFSVTGLRAILDAFKAAGETTMSIYSDPDSGKPAYFNGGGSYAGAMNAQFRSLPDCNAKDPSNCPFHHTGRYAWGAQSLDANDVKAYLEDMLPNQTGLISVDPADGTVDLGNLRVPQNLLKSLKSNKDLAGWSVKTTRGPVPMGVGNAKGGKKTSKKAKAPAPPAAAPNSSPAKAAATPAAPSGKSSAKPVALPASAAAAIGGLLSKLGNGPVADLLKKMYVMPKGGSATAKSAAKSPAPSPATPTASAPAQTPVSKPKSRAGDGPNPPLPTGSPKDFPATGTGPGDFDFSKFDTWDSAGSGSTRPRKVKVGGKLYFVKKAGVNPQYTPEAAANEVNANTALRLAGFYAPDSKLYKDSTGTYCVTLGADISGGELEPKIGTPAVDQQLRDAYPVMSLLYNTDILENADNAFLDSSGRIVFLDNGSTFGYSAQGKRDPVKKFGFDYDTRTDPDPKSPTGIMALSDFSSHGGSLWRKALGSTASDRTENVLRAAAKYRMGDLAKEFIKRGLVPKPAQAAFQQYADGIDALSAKYAPPASATDSLEGISAGRTPASLRLHRVLGDITGIGCDAIVNAANSTLLGGGGVDGAIHKAAGPALLEACRALPEVSPGVRCPAGESRVTEAYDLPACYVIHTVGPVYQGGGNGEAEVLASCYRSALELARECGCTSVAFPAISTGVYGYPAGEASEIAEREVLSYLEEDPDMDVTLVTYAA